MGGPSDDAYDVTDIRSQALRSRLRAHEVGRRRREVLPEVQGKLGHVLGEDIALDRFLDLEDTKQRRERFYTMKRPETFVRRRMRIGCSADALPVLLQHIDRFAAQAKNLRAILLHSMDEYTGAVWVQADTVLANAFAVWTIVDEDLALCSYDLADGFCLEVDHYHWPDGPEDDEYTVTAWGRFV